MNNDTEPTPVPVKNERPTWDQYEAALHNWVIAKRTAKQKFLNPVLERNAQSALTNAEYALTRLAEQHENWWEDAVAKGNANAR